MIITHYIKDKTGLNYTGDNVFPALSRDCTVQFSMTNCFQNTYTRNPIAHPSKRNMSVSLQWCHDGRDVVSNHHPHDCLLKRLSRRISKKTSKLSVIGLCAGNSPVTGEFPTEMAGNAENVSIWWRHHVCEFSVWHVPCFNAALCWVPYIVSNERCFNSSSPGENNRDFTDDIFKRTFLNKQLDFLLKFQWSLFQRVKFTITQCWFS